MSFRMKHEMASSGVFTTGSFSLNDVLSDHRDAGPPLEARE